jgi:hypothetical protein
VFEINAQCGFIVTVVLLISVYLNVILGLKGRIALFGRIACTVAWMLTVLLNGAGWIMSYVSDRPHGMGMTGYSNYLIVAQRL